MALPTDTCPPPLGDPLSRGWLDSWTQLLGRAQGLFGFCKRLSHASSTRWQQMPDMFFFLMATQPLCGSLAFKARGIRRAEAGSDELSKPWMGAIKLILPRDCCHCVRTQDTPERQSSWSALCPAGAMPKQPHGTCGQPPSPLSLLSGQISPCSVQSADMPWGPVWYCHVKTGL